LAPASNLPGISHQAAFLNPFDKYLKDPKLTAASYDYQDFFPSLRQALTWNVNDGQISPAQDR
jgi:multiple sugar transport system substrate-binding protein